MYFYAYKNVQVDKCHVGMVTVRESVNKTVLHRKHHGATSTRIAQRMLFWGDIFLICTSAQRTPRAECIKCSFIVFPSDMKQTQSGPDAGSTTAELPGVRERCYLH